MHTSTDSWLARNPSRLQRLAFLALSCVLLLAGAAYIARGANYLVRGTTISDAIDLRLRWSEERYFLRGQNPYDMWLEHSPWAQRVGLASETDRKADVAPDLGITDPAHPPWGYVTGLAFLWPGWPLVRWYYLLVNLAALAVIAWTAASVVPEVPGLRALSAASVLAMGAISGTLGVGQYGLVVVALLCGALLLERAGKSAPAGLLLALALVKPTLSGPFLLIPLLQRKWRMLAVCATYLALASLITWAVVGVDPVTMLRQLLTVGAVISTEGSANVGTLLLGTTLPRETATLLAMVLVIVPASLVLWSRASADPVIAYAVAALAGRTWAYHKSYDDVLLALLLVAMARACALATSARVALLRGFCWLAVGSILWLPPRIGSSNPVSLAKPAVWLAALVVLLLSARSADEVPQRAAAVTR